MATPKISFVRGAGGLGRPLPNNDHISALLFFNDTLPTGFNTTDRTKAVFSLEQAEQMGIIEGSANHAVEHYQIKSFFEQNPAGKLWISIQVLTAMTTTFDEISEIQSIANGEIRQIGVVDLTDTTLVRIGTDNVHDLIQTQINALKAIDQPIQCLIGFDDSTLSGVSDYETLAAETASNVSIVIGQDGGNVGAALSISNGTSIPAVGAFLGAVSAAKVNENIGWVAKFNFAAAGEFSVPKLNSGELFKTISASTETSLNNYGYLFLKTHTGRSGSYANFSWTAVGQTDDFATIENNRTMDKAIRQIRTFMLPNLNSPVDVNDDGTLTENAIAVFENACSRGLDSMERDTEISAFDVKIDPTQNILGTANMIISVAIVPVGVAKQITINIGFAVSV
tara:strand:- start:6407 stop:7594 length:1188 start_codon:yes stop_codon:yes gene_type:complete